MCKAVIYIRVSTRKQEITGLGIEAQRRIATDFCQSRQWEVTREFIEVQSGGRNDREMIREALEQCELTGSVLVVAKLDRISRDVGFIDQLQKSNVRFVCADMPEANQTMIQFMAVFAAYERKMASERTRAALEGKEGLGNPNTTAERKGSTTHRGSQS
ncbi:recombinase family protein [Oceanospirillum sediminis]|uniref:Recombinase family protein n=1 Tax=Oceanospirillum sediminis TaxID=2760088 RepID=A0A839ITL2_9GAMM|nr:recombinase family protein [Oceanospirillum sediminis]MBB1488655.1 recombinase family protein [Oceanospirillum sediminis]